MNILSLNPWRVKQFMKQACWVNVVASFFPLKIFILLCFNILSTVPHENQLADSLYIYIYIYRSYLKVMDTGFLNMLIGTSIVIWYLLHLAYECQLLYLRENKWIYLEANHLSIFLVISYFFLTCVISSYLKLLMVLSTGKKKWRWLISLLINM